MSRLPRETGFKTHMRAALTEMARHRPHELEAWLSSDEIERLWKNAVANLLAKQDTPTVKLVAELKGLVGRRSQSELSLNVNMTGDQFNELVATAQDAVEMTDEERFEACLVEVEHVLRAEPGRRRQVLERLGGRFVETSETIAGG